jgi:hypothetical protein
LNWFKKVSVCLTFSSLFLSIPQFLKPEFKIPPVHLDIPLNPSWESSPPNGEILSILDQPFIYLAHGNQATVFVSEDGQYVLKLFRYSRPRFPIIQKIKSMAATLLQKKPKNDLYTKMAKTFDAAHLAYTEARDFTQVLFCHLNLTDKQLPTVSLKARRLYTLPMDKHRFVLQKKVAPFKETLLCARKNPEEMHRLIDGLIDLLQNRIAQGIRNSDPNLAPNFGFLDGKAVELDFGNYRKAPPRLNEMSDYLLRLEHWLKKNAPEYVEYLRIKSPISYHPIHEITSEIDRSSGIIQ